MKLAYFDCFSGISGDMALGALLDLGVDQEAFRRELGKLGLGGYRIDIDTVVRHGIRGTDVNVIVEEEKGDHHHHSGEDQHQHHHGRNLRDIELIIDTSALNTKVKELSKKVFREIARAEAKVHNKSIDEVHFREAGTLDSIVDVVGTLICLDLLGVDRVVSSPLHDGKGFVKSRHGIIPVPVPAVLEMLSGSGIPFIQEDIDTELVTPTGMGLIKCLAQDFGAMPAMIIDRVGYGMGKRDTGRLNALRVVLGRLQERNWLMEELMMLETNLDDMSPEVLGYTFERLMEAGALDVYYTPVYMKKNRPAVMLTVLCKQEDEKRLVDILMRETSTLGVRRSGLQRYRLDREIVKVSTRFGEVRVKVASAGDVKKLAPEYEDVRSIAVKSGIPLSEVYSVVADTARNQLEKS